MSTGPYSKEIKQSTNSAFNETGTNTRQSVQGKKWFKQKSSSGNINENNLKQTQTEFKSMQLNLLNLFTEAKGSLEIFYKKTLMKVKKAQKILQMGLKDNAIFMQTISTINQQACTKLDNIHSSIQSSLIDLSLFDKLYTSYPKENFQPKKKQKSSNISIAKISQGKINSVLDKLEEISEKQYQKTTILQPKNKKIQNSNWLTGKWQCLQKIIFQGKGIQSLVPLSTVEAPFLRDINLRSNSIRELSSFSEAYFPNLNILDLRKNNIVHLNGLQQANFPQLKILNLSHNRIRNIQILSQVGFPQLVELNLCENSIDDLHPLATVMFPKLEILNLDHNRLRTLEPLVLSSFFHLKILSFCYNDIMDLDPLSQMKLKKLQALLGYNNKIKNIDFLKKCEIPNVKQIFLNNNQIRDLSVIKSLNLKNLKEFDLENNLIQDQQYLCFAAKNPQSQEAKKKYPFLQL